jgi:hypothetical protein
LDFGRDSGGGDDTFGGVVIEQTALIRHCVNELFGFEPKNKQIEAIRHLLYDKRDLVLNAHCQNRLKLGKALKYLPGTPLIQE